MDAGTVQVDPPPFQIACSQLTRDGTGYAYAIDVEHDGGGSGNFLLHVVAAAGELAALGPTGTDPDSVYHLMGRFDAPADAGALAARFEYQDVAGDPWRDAGGSFPLGGGVCP